MGLAGEEEEADALGDAATSVESAGFGADVASAFARGDGDATVADASWGFDPMSLNAAAAPRPRTSAAAAPTWRERRPRDGCGASPDQVRSVRWLATVEAMPPPREIEPELRAAARGSSFGFVRAPTSDSRAATGTKSKLPANG